MKLKILGWIKDKRSARLEREQLKGDIAEFLESEDGRKAAEALIRFGIIRPITITED